MPSSAPDISVVIPVYHGENTLKPLAEALQAALSAITRRYEVVLVNDASPDGSWGEIERLCRLDPRFKGIDLARNAGQQAAISAGVLHACGDWVAVMDCDLQDPPEYLPALWRKAQQGYDVVMARRSGRPATPCRRLASRLFHGLLSLRRGVKTDPAVANYALYPRRIIEAYRRRQQPSRPFSALDYLRGCSVALVDVPNPPSARGRSSYTPGKLFRAAFGLLFPGGFRNRILFQIRTTVNVATKGYGVRLVRLTADKIEQVRQWRNAPHVAVHMAFREEISPEAQQAWFRSVENERNRYCIIEAGGKEAGLCNLKAIDYRHRRAETGIFIGEAEFLDSDLPIRASLCGLDYNFEVLGLKTLTAHILADNHRAIRFNRAFGFRPQRGEEKKQLQRYLLTRADYYKYRVPLVALLPDDDSL